MLRHGLHHPNLNGSHHQFVDGCGRGRYPPVGLLCGVGLGLVLWASVGGGGLGFGLELEFGSGTGTGS